MSGFSTFWVTHETGQSATGNQIRVQQMAILSRRTPVIFIAVGANAVLTGGVAGAIQQPEFALVWTIIMVAMSVAGLVRWVIRRRKTLPKRVSERGPRKVAIAATVQGTIWGVGCAIMFPIMPGFEQMLIGIVLAGMAAAGASVLATVPAASMGYTVGCLVPFAFRLALHDDALSLSLAAMTLIYMVALLATARSFYISFIDSVRGRVATERLLTELSAARQDLLDAIASSTEGFALFNSEGGLVVANDRFAELLQLKSEVARSGRTYEELLKGADSNLPEDWISAQVARYHACDGLQVVAVPDGRWLGIGHRKAGHGGVVTTLIDLTVFKQNEAELIRAKVAAEAANASKSEFLAMMSHELRTPLNAILGFAEIFINEMFGPHSDERYRIYASDIHEGGQHLLQVINNILDLSKVEAGKLDIPVITYEAGEALRLDERCIVTGVRGIVNVMRTLRMLRARPTRTARAEPYIARSTNWYRAPLDGMFRSLVSLGARVEPGDSLGVISAPFSDVEEVVLAKADGIVICVNNLPLVNEGEALFHIARFGEAAAVEEQIAEHGSTIEGDRLFEIESMPQP